LDAVPDRLQDICVPSPLRVDIYDMQAGSLRKCQRAEIVERCLALLTQHAPPDSAVFYCRHVFLPTRAAVSVNSGEPWFGRSNPILQ